MAVDVREQIEDILKNHDQELQAIEGQIKQERRRLAEDLEEIRARAYPGGTRFDSVRVQTSNDPDGKLVGIMADIQRREKVADRAIATLEDRRRLIESVHHHVLSLDARSKCTLLALYYPTRTYDEAAEVLKCDRSTVARRRRSAMKRLVARVNRLNKEAFENKRNQNPDTDCNCLTL